ncbi:MAG: ZIP family metal transporter [Gammaproteobacteria bacterium]|nr:ZIP family metal transporter [Gammaproteobacteria bacterium]
MDYSDSLLLLTGYSVVIVAGSLLGGWLPSVIQMTHTRIQVAMTFVAGLILGVAVYHLLPYSLTTISGDHAVETAVWWMMLGVVAMVLMLRFFHFHQHDFSEGEDNIHAHHDHGAAAVHPLSWLGIALGLGLHSLTEGIALGGSLRVGLSHEGVGGLAGFGVFLAILSHKPLDALSIAGTMQAAGLGRRLRTSAIMIFALICPVVAFLTFWGVGLLGPSGPHVMGCGLAFAAGAFLCISLSDLLPEVHFHSHDRVKLMLSFLAGVGFIYMLRFIGFDAMHMVGIPVPMEYYQLIMQAA